MRILLTGATGYLGSFVLEQLLDAAHEVISLGRHSHPILAPNPNLKEVSFDAAADTPFSISSIEGPFDAVVHLAALASPAECEQRPGVAERINVIWTRDLIGFAEQHSAYFCYISTDLVFEGGKAPRGGFKEEASPSPQSVYAFTKQAAEEAVRSFRGSWSILRVSLLFGAPFGPRQGPLGWIMKSLRDGNPVTLFEDEWRTPVFVRDVAQCIEVVIKNRSQGLFHCAGPDRLSRVQLGNMLIDYFGFSPDLMVSAKRADLESVPARPEDVSLNISKIRSELGIFIHRLGEILGTFPDPRKSL